MNRVEESKLLDVLSLFSGLISLHLEHLKYLGSSDGAYRCEAGPFPMVFYGPLEVRFGWELFACLLFHPQTWCFNGRCFNVFNMFSMTT